MKKRLISMLMAVLMIASLLPASAVLAEETTAATECKHKSTTVVTISKKDTTNKVPGVKATICDDCHEVTAVTIEAFRTGIFACRDCKTNKVVEVQKAACEQPGLTVSYCEKCGSAFPVETLASEKGKTAYFKAEKPLAHNYSYFNVEVAPTCLYDGWGYVLCTRCGAGQFVANAKAALEIVEANKVLSLAEYNVLSGKVKDMFSATNPGHKDHDGFKLVTEKTYAKDYNGDYKYGENGQKIELMPKTDTVHVKTIEGKVHKFDNETGTYVEVANAAKVELGYSGDKICPVCGEGFKDGEPDTKAHTVDANKQGAYVGEMPTTAEKGKYDRVYCADCGVWIGGGEIPKLSNTWTVPAKAATCTAPGSYKAVYTKDTNGDVTVKWYNGNTEVKDTDGVIKALGHKWVACGMKNATCTEDGKIYTNLKQCSVCKQYKDGDTVLENPETAAGTVIPAPGHKYVEKELVAATCNHPGVAVKKCSECDKYQLINDELPFSDNNGVYNYPTKQKTEHVASDKLANVKEATCTEEGYTGDVVCKFCGKVMKPGEKTKMVDHTPVDVEAKAPTCTEPGVTKGTVCSVCKKVLSAQETVPALGHDPKLVNAKDATCTEAGYTGDKVCTRCNVTLEKGKDIKALGHNYVKGVCSRCDAKQTGYNPFSDVKSTDRFYSDIMWAWENGIVEGDNTGMFRADGKLTRAQVVTMLWRMNDKPTAKNAATFTDLTQDWYKAAVAWAVEKGIVNGVGNNKFAPNETCTRAQIVTMLWRLDGEKKVTPTINFTDLTQNWYKDAVAWAANNGITKGDGAGHFYPANDCTRGEAVAFIHRTAMLGK